MPNSSLSALFGLAESRLRIVWRLNDETAGFRGRPPTERVNPRKLNVYGLALAPQLPPVGWPLGRAGWFNYHAVPGNIDSLNASAVRFFGFGSAALRRRGQRRPMTWARFLTLVRRWLPSARILHLIRTCALTLPIQGGTVCSNSARTVLCRGRRGERRPYRDESLASHRDGRAPRWQGATTENTGSI